MAGPAFAAALALLVQTAAPAFSPPGVHWALVPAGPTVRTEYDPASIRRYGDRVTVTMRSEPLAHQSEEKLVAVMVIDCPGRAYGIQTYHTYTMAGVHLETHSVPLAEVQVEPRSQGGIDELHDAVCAAP